MRGTKTRAASLLLVTSGLLVACGDNDNNGTDAGRPDSGIRDSGSDSGSAPPDAQLDAPVAEDGGPPDAPSDAGPAPPSLRLAHLMPGGPAVHVCMQVPADLGAWTLITRDAVTTMPTAIPYKGVSRYTPVPLPPINVRVAVYDAAAIGGASPSCPMMPTAALINQLINGSSFSSGQFYTVAATGLPSGGSEETLPELNIIPDDLSDPATAGNTRLRLYNAVPNFPLTITGVDLCLDPDGPDGPAMPAELIEDASFEEVNTYLERAAITAGLLTLHAHHPLLDCLQDRPPAGTLLARIPVPIPLPAGVPANYTATFDGDTSNTIFLVGDATVMVTPETACTMDSMCTGAGPKGTVCQIPADRTMGFCSHPNAVTILPIDDTTGM